MKTYSQHLYEELRETEEELINKLKKDDLEEWFSKLLIAELKDVQSTMEKIDCGTYGKCEISGEILPDFILRIVPTLKTQQDVSNIEAFCRKSLNDF